MLETNLHQQPQEQAFVRSLDWETNRVSATLVIGGRVHEVWFSANTELFQQTDFLLPVGLLPAMRVGAALELPGEISPRLLSSLPQIQDIFNMWESIYKRIPVKAGARGALAERGKGVGCFFSGGVDSFHAALKHREEISHLIYLYLPWLPTDERFSSVRKARAAAEALGKPLIEVDTNLFDFARKTSAGWNKYYYGMWIISVGLLLQHRFRKFFIAGSSTSNYDNLRPQGTHPILDPLWSTELTTFYHDGCEVRRVDKAAYIADHEVAMRHLQVCDAFNGSHNCGHCIKCLRTMLNLTAAGALKRCETLPDEIDVAAVKELDLSEYSESYLARENLRALKRRGTEPELVDALEAALDRGAVKMVHSRYKEEEYQARLKAIRERTRARSLEAQAQLRSKLRSEVEDTRQQLRRVNQENRNLEQENGSLKREKARLTRRARVLRRTNSRLIAHYSAQRLRVIDIAMRKIVKIPGVNRLLVEIRTKL